MPPEISQSLLAELLRLREAELEIDRSLSSLRQQIIDLHDAGATVVPGPLTLSVSEQSRRPLTIRALVELLGAEEVSRLQDMITPVTRRIILVR
jgi:hypothetical protein